MSVKIATKPQQLFTRQRSEHQETINKELKNHVINAARGIKTQPREMNANFFEKLCWKIAYFFTGDSCYADRLFARENYLNELMDIFVGYDYNDKANSYNLHFRTSNELDNDGDSVIEIFVDANDTITSIQGQSRGVIFYEKISSNSHVSVKNAITNLCQQAFVHQLNEAQTNRRDSIAMSLPCQEKYCAISADILNEGWPGLYYLEQGIKNGKISIRTLANMEPLPDYTTLQKSGLINCIFANEKYLEMFISVRNQYPHAQELFVFDLFDGAITDVDKQKVIMAAINSGASIKVLENKSNIRIDGTSPITYALKYAGENGLKNMFYANDVTLTDIIKFGRLGDCKPLWKSIVYNDLASIKNLETGKCSVTDFTKFVWSDMSTQYAIKLMESQSIGIQYFREMDDFNVSMFSFSEADIEKIISVGFNFSEIQKMFPGVTECELLSKITEKHKITEFLTGCFFDKTTLTRIAANPDGYALITQDGTLSTALKNKTLDDDIRNVLFLALEAKEAKHSFRELSSLGFTDTDYNNNGMLQKLYFGKPEVAIIKGFSAQAIIDMGYSIEDAIRAAVDSGLPIDQLIKYFFDSTTLKYALENNEELINSFIDDPSITRELISGEKIAIKDVFSQIYKKWGADKCFLRGFTVADFIQAGKVNDCLADKNKWLDAIRAGVKINDFIKYRNNASIPVSDIHSFVYDARDKLSYSTLISFFTSDTLEQFMRESDLYLRFIVENEGFEEETFKHYANINSLLRLVPKEMQYGMMISNRFRAHLLLEVGFISNYVNEIVIRKDNPDDKFYDYLISKKITNSVLRSKGVTSENLTNFVLANNNKHFNELISKGFFDSPYQLAYMLASAKEFIHATHFDDTVGSVAESVRNSELDISDVISSCLSLKGLGGTGAYLSGLGFRYTDIKNKNDYARCEFMKDNPFCWVDVYYDALDSGYDGDIFAHLNIWDEIIIHVWDGLRKRISDINLNQFLEFFELDVGQCQKISGLIGRIGLYFMTKSALDNNLKSRIDVMSKIKEFGFSMSDIDDETLKDNADEIRRFIWAFANGHTNDLLSIGLTNEICNKVFQRFDTFRLAMKNSKASARELVKAGFEASFIIEHGDINVETELLSLKNKFYSPSFVEFMIGELGLTKQYFTEKGVDVTWLKKQIVGNKNTSASLKQYVKKGW